MDYGIGVDTPSGDSRNLGVLGTPASIPNASGSIVEFAMTQVSSDEDLQSAMGISASASGGVGLFSGSASMDFAHNRHVHTSSVFLVVSVKVTLAFSQISAPKILPEAAAKLVDGNPTRFQEMFGDSFVRGIQTGGCLFGVIEIATSSTTEHQKISAAAQGTYGLFSGKGSFSSEFTDTLSNRSFKLTLHRQGGVVTKDPSSLEELQALAAGFAASVEGHGVPYAVLLDKYTILDLPNPPNYIDLENQMDVLAFCAERRNAIWTSLNNVNFILDHPAQFSERPDGDDMAPLVAYREDLAKDLKAVKDAASQALDHPRQAKLPTLSAKVPALPKRRAGESNSLAALGEIAANRDPLAAVLRESQAAGEQRLGFHIGMGVMDTHLLWGPGAQSIKDSLSAVSQSGFAMASAYCLQRNNNADVARKGLAVVTADSSGQAARKLLPVGTSWLGFDIASAIYGNRELGAQGNTEMGPGAQAIRASLDADGQRGFDAGVALYLKQK